MVTKQKLVNIRIICLYLLTHFKYNNIHFQYTEYFIYTKLFSVNCNSILIATYCAIYVEAHLLYIERKTSALETFNTFLRLTSIASRHEVVCLSDICI
jgi:hypothetical protein